MDASKNSDSMNNISPGWKQEIFDGRDHYYVPDRRVALHSLTMPFILKANVETGGFFGPVYDQGAWETCVANATAAAFAYEWKRQGLGDFAPSRLFLYWHARNIQHELKDKSSSDPNSKSGNDQGTFVRNAMKVLHKIGVCDEHFWPYDEEHYAREPDRVAGEDAKQSVSIAYARIDPDNPGKDAALLSKADQKTIGDMTLLRLRQCLAEGHPIVFGFMIFHGDRPWAHKVGNDWHMVPLPDPLFRPIRPARGHCVLAIGFDDEMERIYCQNSFGDRDENVPYFFMGYEWVRDFSATKDFWMLRTVQDKAPDMHPSL